MYLKEKTYEQNINLIKKNLSYYKRSKDCLLITNYVSMKKILLIESDLDMNFELVDHEDEYSFLDKKRSLTFVSVQLTRRCILTNDIPLKKIKRLFFAHFFFKHAFLLKNYLEGRVYRAFKNGFAIVLSGLVCFLPLNNCSYVNFTIGESNLFFILFLNTSKTKSTVLSQRKVYRKVHSVLLKMSSRLAFLKN